jgi:UDP-glucuronate 4-epimerase
LGISLPEDAGGLNQVVSKKYPNIAFFKLDLGDTKNIEALFQERRFDMVLHLAAQAGVRYSMTHPEAYIESNIQGFLTILEACRRHPVQRLIYASSSSVYGTNTKQPFSETDAVDNPASLYAVTKRANELMARSYQALYDIQSTALRFFTVYGPWGRPDMAPFLFTKAIIEGNPISVFNHGRMSRDFTYIDDIIEGIVRVMALDKPAAIYNIGNGKPVDLLRFIQALEDELGVKGIKNMLPMQRGEVPVTWADCTALERDTGFRPQIDFEAGIKQFVKWYKSFYQEKE